MSWLTVNDNGGGVIDVTAEANPETTRRYSVVSVNQNIGIEYVNIKQKPNLWYNEIYFNGYFLADFGLIQEKVSIYTPVDNFGDKSGTLTISSLDTNEGSYFYVSSITGDEFKCASIALTFSNNQALPFTSVAFAVVNDNDFYYTYGNVISATVFINSYMLTGMNVSFTVEINNIEYEFNVIISKPNN